jgi:hypothetical protein
LRKRAVAANSNSDKKEIRETEIGEAHLGLHA